MNSKAVLGAGLKIWLITPILFLTYYMIWLLIGFSVFLAESFE